MVHNWTIFSEKSVEKRKAKSKIKGNSNLKILYSTSFNLDNIPLDNNIYIIKSWEELDDILNFYKDYEIDTLEKKEQI